MPFTCIPKEYIDDVKRVVASTSSSIERNRLLTEMFGEEGASFINKQYEKSLLLKNPNLDKFMEGFTELGIEKKQAIKERIAERLANRTQKIENNELLSIAQDIWNRKYKLDISLEDAKIVNNLKKELNILDEARKGKPYQSTEATAYGLKFAELKNVIGELKNPNDKLGILDSIKVGLKEKASRFSKEQGVLENISQAGKLISETLGAGVYKSMQASADLSYSLRQGFKVFTKNPKIWKENWVAAFEPFKHITNKEEQQKIADSFLAKMVSHTLYDKAIKAKLGIGVVEEFFPTTVAEKIPILGNIFKASNEAFTIFSQGSRMGLFEDMYVKALNNGVKETPELLKNIAQLSNSLTGRGHLGELEKVSGFVNKLFYSGRYIKSSIDTFYLPFKPGLDPFVKHEAMKSSINTIAMIGTLMYTASLFTDVEWNPLSSKFGKMKVPGSKDTWTDLTGGLGSYITLASKMALQKSKSSTTGKIIELNKRDKKGNIVFGGQTMFDVGVDWLSGKLAPVPSAVVQYAKGSNYQGNKPTAFNTAQNLVTPIAVGNAMQNILSDEDSISKLIASTADILGMNQTNYSKFKK